MTKLESINPCNGEIIARYEEMTGAEVAELIKQSDAAFQQWRRTDFFQRAGRLKQAAAVLQSRKSDFAKLMALEMGKPIAQGIAEVEKCAWTCEFYADHAEGFLTPEMVVTDAAKSYVTFCPLGVVLAVMPWNFPFWQVFRFAAPALMAGNTALLKHSSNVTGCALAIEQTFQAADLPPGVFRTLRLSSAGAPPVIAHPLVRAVTLTGSTPAGRKVASLAGEHLKKTVLELGGSDPYLILADADLDAAAPACVAARMINGGQSCIAAKRFIVVEAMRERFEKQFVALMQKRIMGDPLEQGIDLGPMARHDLRTELHDQVVRSIQAGARLLLGGKMPSGPGAFYPPTVLTDVRPGMPAYHEELFGPVAAIIPVQDEVEAIRAANDSDFGLGAAVFSRDLARAERIAAERLEAGACFVNAAVKSDPRLPFGGIKQSGYGRELSSFGIREFVNVKSVYIGAK